MNKKHDFRTAYIDLLLNLLITIVFLFSMTNIVKITKEQEGLKKDAQMMIQVEWDKSLDCDVDIWVKDPANNIVSYNQPSVGVMHIERDDRGVSRDTAKIGDVAIASFDKNQEIWALRGKQDGEFLFNVHLYACYEKGKDLKIKSLKDVPLTVDFYKLNPSISKIKSEKITLNYIWEEKHLFAFKINNGNVDFYQNPTKMVMNRTGTY